jgi:hypothetical protein
VFVIFFHRSKFSAWWTAVLCVGLCMGLYLVFEIFDLDGSKFHIDVVDVDGTDCFELRLGQLFRPDSTTSYFLESLPSSPFSSHQLGYLSYLLPPKSSAKLMALRNLCQLTAQIDYARPLKMPRREHTSKTLSTDEPA